MGGAMGREKKIGKKEQRGNGTGDKEGDDDEG